MVVIHNIKDPQKVATPLKSSIYRTDSTNPPSSYDAYSVKSAITQPDMAAINEEETNDVYNIADARYDVINRCKLTEFAVTFGADDTLTKYIAKTGETNLLSLSPFGNWRNFNINGFSEISKRVIPVVEFTDSMGYSYEISFAKDTALNNPMIKKATDIANKANEVIAMAAELTGRKSSVPRGAYMSRFQQLPVTKGAGYKTESGGELKLKFNFGQAQMFSGEDEVVKPILAIMNIFSAQGVGGSSNRIAGPFVTEDRFSRIVNTYFLGTSIKNAATAIKNAMEGLGDSESAAGAGKVIDAALDAANGITSGIWAAFDSSAAQAIKEEKTIVVNIGNHVMGPFITSSVKWQFNYENVDEYGYPCSGEISMTLQPLLVSLGSDIIRQWGYPTGKSSGSAPSGVYTIKDLIDTAKDSLIGVINRKKIDDNV